ncbi:MAG TPA: trehalose-phosphatase [Paucimonas sp.]|nr:trehalose-phosphatase [Paucimonas sp.]
MRHLLSPAGEEALVAMIETGALLAFDFDGTLSPMVMLPEQARMPAGVARGFQMLCEMAPVAVITGRSVEDVVPRLGAKPKYVIGNHGAEGVPGADGNLQPYREICERWRHQISDILRWERFDPGLMIEYKSCSICVHYRLVRNRNETERNIEAALPLLDPTPLVIGGTHGINLLPPGAPTKRLALESLLRIEGKQAAFYIGDDETDEIVFRGAPPDWVTVRAEREHGSAARFFLLHQSEMTECLKLIVRLLQRPKRRDFSFAR